MSRAAVHSAIATSAELHALGYAGAEVYRTVGMENSEADKLIVLRWGSNPRTMMSHGNEFLTVWVYDRGRSYTDIDKAIKIIKNLLLGLVDIGGSDGEYLSQINWNGTSDDLYDDGMKRVTRNAVFTVNSRVAL